MADYRVVAGATKDNTCVHQVCGLFLGKVVDAYDGDTCRVAVAFPGSPGASSEPVAEQLNVRMLGYDAPEMKKKRKDDVADPKPYGTEVREVFRTLVLNRVVVLDIPRPEKPDPYGRVLAHMYVAEAANEALVTARAVDRQPKKSGGLFAWLGRGKSAAVASQSAAAAPAEPRRMEIRGREVEVPATVDVPEGFPLSTTSLEDLTHVNTWMVENARVKAYDGSTARPDWTLEELTNGIP